MLLVQVGGDEVSAKCDNCNTEFDPLSMMVLSRNGRIREVNPNVHGPRLAERSRQAESASNYPIQRDT